MFHEEKEEGPKKYSTSDKVHAPFMSTALPSIQLGFPSSISFCIPNSATGTIGSLGAFDSSVQTIFGVTPSKLLRMFLL